MLTINARTHSGEAVQKAPYPGTNRPAKLLNRTALPQRCLLWVKSGKAHTEQMLSAFTSLATFERTCRDVGLVP